LIQTDTKRDSIPLSQKIAFGIGMLANQMFPAVLGIFMVVLVQGLGMSPLLWSLIFFLPKLIDAITDPLMGYISDHTISRWGKRRPYVFIGAIISGFSFVMMWQLSAENSEMYNFYYFLFWSCVFWIGMTIFSVPYVAMGYEMSSEFHERTRLMAVAQWIGQWAWVLAPWLWIFLYDPDWFESAAEGAKYLSLWVGGICMVLALVPAIFCRSTTGVGDKLKLGNVDGLLDTVKDFISGIIITFKNKPFQKICIATFFIFNSFQTIAAFSWFIIVYYMNNGDTAQAGVWPTLFGSVMSLCTCFLVIPVVNGMAQKYGKRYTFLFTQSISLFGYILLWWCFSPKNPWMIFIPLPLIAFGIGGLFTLMMSMTADICDLDELETGERREGTFGAIYWWMVKLGAAFAGGAAGLILSAIGFDQNVTLQSESTLVLLRLSYIVIPCIGTIIAILVMRNYDLDESKANEIRIKLDARNMA
jgi:GPH family glycoside/pentoside/hexuronide:cation symporter|tara:strand:+ start:48 stop:1466 length:1419 start_codon:yes stop_codon:yes gene_type:complete